jgi:dienelactone hydrolase
VICRFAAGIIAFAAFGAVAQASPQRVAIPGENGTTIEAWLYAPASPGPHRAVVALHGCAGVMGRNGGPSPRHADWGERWAAAGFLALFPDSFASRGLGPQCKVSEREVHPSRQRVADAEAALKFLAARPDVDPKQISLVGWSNGGSSTLYAVEPKNAPGGVDFVRAIAFYPGCRTPLESGSWRTRMPLLLLIGESDDWTPAAPCAALAADAKAKGEPVEFVAYPNAYHDFDHPGQPVHVVGGLAFSGSGGGEAHSGTDPSARADAIRRVMETLSQ